MYGHCVPTTIHTRMRTNTHTRTHTHTYTHKRVRTHMSARSYFASDPQPTPPSQLPRPKLHNIQPVVLDTNTQPPLRGAAAQVGARAHNSRGMALPLLLLPAPVQVAGKRRGVAA